MAGFDLDAQRSGRIPGFGVIEAGYFDFSTASRTADVPTRTTKCVMGFAIAQEKDPDWFGVVATTDGDVTNGNITFKRQTSYLNEDLRVYYLLMGY